MKKSYLLLAFVAINLACFAQDKVVLKSGDTLNVQVTKNTDTSIEFTYPNETLVNEKKKKDIACIIYASGRREEIKIKTIDVPIISSKDDWEKVVVTKNREDVEGLTKVKDIAAVGGGGVFHTVSFAQESATKSIKKKAAKLQCGIVLITKEDFGGPYRNTLNLAGEAYRK